MQLPCAERATAQGETLSVTHNDDEPNDYTAGTEAALAAAQQAQQQAMHVEQEALAEERQSLMQLREVMQQQPGQFSGLISSASLVLTQQAACKRYL